MLNDGEGGGKEPALHTKVWGLRHLPARGGRVTWSWGRTGFPYGKRTASSGRRRPRRAGEGGARSSPWSGEIDGRGQALARGIGAGVDRRVRKDVHGFDSGEEGRWWGRGDRASRTIPIAGTMGFPAVGAAGRRGNAAIQGRFKVAVFRAGEVGAAVLRLGVGTGANGADSRILASLFDMAKLPAVAALCERGGVIGTFDNTVLAVEQGKGGVCHPPTMFSGDLHHHRAGTLSDRTRLAVRIEVAGSFYYEALGVVDGGGEGGGEEGVVIRHGIEREAVNGELEVSGGESEGLPGVVSNREGLIEAGGESLKKGGIGGGRDGGVDNGESDGAFTVDKELE